MYSLLFRKVFIYKKPENDEDLDMLLRDIEIRNEEANNVLV
jgi:hypothetical protein